MTVSVDSMLDDIKEAFEDHEGAEARGACLRAITYWMVHQPKGERDELLKGLDEHPDYWAGVR